MATKNTNLRVLSLAYSNGKLTRDQYQELRAKQLSAIEFGKPYPPLPASLENVEIPSVKIDAPRGKRPSSNKLPLFIILLVLIAAGVVAAIMLSGDKSGPATVSQETTIPALAQALLESDDLPTDQLLAFGEKWQAANSKQHKIHRSSLWFGEFVAALELAIGDIETVKALNGIDEQAEEKLFILQQLLADLKGTSQPATAPAASTDSTAADIEDQAEPGLLDGILGTPETAPESPATEQEELLDEIMPETAPQPNAETSAEEDAPEAEIIEPAPAPQETAAPAEEPTPQPAAVPATPSDPTPAATPEEEAPAADQDGTVPTEDTAAPAESSADPAPLTPGFDPNPEYEREPEFGKDARDSILGDTPSY